MIAQQLVESVWCQYHRPQPGVLFVVGFSVALLVSNYTEARLLVNRDLFWIFLVALPISMVRQVELVAVDPTPCRAARLARARARAAGAQARGTRPAARPQAAPAGATARSRVGRAARPSDRATARSRAPRRRPRRERS